MKKRSLIGLGVTLIALSVVTVALLISAHRQGFTFGRTKVAFTFDDGTADHYAVAALVLEKYGYRGVFSIVTGKVGTKGYMTWDQVKDLGSRGHVISLHTRDHENLGKLFKANQLKKIMYQIAEAKGDLSKNAGIEAKYLCFPFGSHNRELDEIVRSYGLEPIVVDRIDLGGGGGGSNPMLNVGEYLNDIGKSFLKSQYVLMFHVVNDAAGYAAYGDDGGKFETVVRNIKLHDGEWYDVVNYDDNEWELEDKSTPRLKRRAERLKSVMQEKGWCVK